MKSNSAVLSMLTKAREESLDLEKLNRAAEGLNAEMEDVWKYQAVEELSTRIPSPRK